MSDPTPRPAFGSFLPLLLLALSSLIFLTWNLTVAVQQHEAGLRIADQQQEQLTQATAVESRLRQMMQDLVDLAGRNADAAAIVKKYGISFRGPAAAAAAAAPAPAPAVPAASPAKKP